MSSSQVRSKFTEPLLKRLNRDMRTPIQDQKGQLLVLDNVKELQDLLARMLPGRKYKKSSLIRALKAARKKAAALERQVPKRRRTRIINRLPQVLPETKFRHGVNVFVVQNFYSSIDTIKKTIFEVLVKEGVLSESESSEVAPHLHKGHGAEGNAVIQSKIASTFAGLSQSQLAMVKQGLDSFGMQADFKDDAENIKKLLTVHDQVVTKRGNLKAQYFSIVSFQDGAANLEEGQEEGRLRRSYENFLKDASEYIPDLQGSSTMKEKVIAYLGHEFTQKNPNVKVKFKKAELKSSGKSEARAPSKKPKIRMSRASRNVRIKTKGVGSTPFHLFLSMNARLPEVVAKNMRKPGLEYQSGRFAKSVKITDVMLTPKGFPSVGYTYMLYPYQTFEPGFAQGNLEKDPRTLIDRSIREIAAQFAMGRFYTRRV